MLAGRFAAGKSVASNAAALAGKNFWSVERAKELGLGKAP